ncbi:hypothetical protein Moror_10196 [Moniliophthora roreri MCA 2997]|uniref:Ser-Thr-rich glycosyl-phosphatidyl-inositol-anchored membrane family-domain-containing protein n=1 Tax=Moniliophthora roreri (strain MCA 2997) TaxID=1381753 RepID=V2WRZ9_MONRO|nr:hypothetical protein Moror_10196 [Moniliophthora roreri MCA 2997]
MFPKLALLALAGASAVQALTLNTPTDVTSGGRITLTWSAVQSDPIFTLELHHPTLLQDIAIANNVDPSLMQLDILMPIVLARDDQYVIRAVNVSNIDDEFARTGNFFVGDTVSSSAASGSVTATNPPSGASTTTSAPQTASTTRPNTSGTGSNTASSTGQSGSEAPTNTPLNGGNNGAGSIGANLGLLVAAVGAVAAAL